MRMFTYDVVKHIEAIDNEDALIDVIAIAETKLNKLREEQGYCEL